MSSVPSSKGSIPGYSFLSTWDFSVDPCESAGAHFLGVLCVIPDSDDNTSNSRITTLDLDGAGYDGFLTEDIGNLTADHPEPIGLRRLQELDVSSNKLTGSIPSWIANFRGMTSLKMCNNGFSEVITLNLSVNWFTEIEMAKFSGRATQLEVLDVQENRLQGLHV